MQERIINLIGDLPVASKIVWAIRIEGLYVDMTSMLPARRSGERLVWSTEVQPDDPNVPELVRNFLIGGHPSTVSFDLERVTVDQPGIPDRTSLSLSIGRRTIIVDATSHSLFGGDRIVKPLRQRSLDVSFIEDGRRIDTLSPARVEVPAGFLPTSGNLKRAFEISSQIVQFAARSRTTTALAAAG